MIQKVKYCSGCLNKFYWFHRKNICRIDGVYYVIHNNNDCWKLLLKNIGIFIENNP